MKIKLGILAIFFLGTIAVSFFFARIDSFPFLKTMIATITLAANLHYLNAQLLIKQLPAKTRETFSKKLIYLAFAIFLFFFAIDLYSNKLNLLVSTVGIAMTVIGSFFYTKSIVFLGRFFSLDVEIKQGHSLLKTGPFSIVRHPAYLASWLLFIGMALAANSIACAATLAFFFLLWYYYRIRIEEKALLAEFGKEFEEYKERVPALIPKLF